MSASPWTLEAGIRMMGTVEHLRITPLGWSIRIAFGVIIFGWLIVSLLPRPLPPVTPSVPAFVNDAPCEGTEIPVQYGFSKAFLEPFECNPYCTDRKTKPHYILYEDGYATPCGVTECSDYGEDHCITCTPSAAIRAKYKLPTPEGPAPCAQ